MGTEPRASVLECLSYFWRLHLRGSTMDIPVCRSTAPQTLHSHAAHQTDANIPPHGTLAQ